MDLLELVSTSPDLARSPKRFLIACDSSTSPIGVEVPWALMYPICSLSMPASLMALVMQRKAPSCCGAGCVM